MAQTHRDKALERAEAGANVAAAIRDASYAELPPDADLINALAYRIHQCNHASNVWTATDMHTQDGDAYDGSGRFWNCGSKLCPHCVTRQSRRARRQLRTVLEGERLLVGENYHFLTLTMPTQDLPLLDARALMQHAWSVFRKKTWFKLTIKGGFRSEEFTLNRHGYHYHSHLIVRSKWIDYNSFRHYWTEALRHAFATAGRDLNIHTVDGRAFANCRRVGSITQAINEVAKYITKSDSWAKLKSAELLAVCRIERWPRMVEFFGSFKSFLSGVAVPENDVTDKETILDTKSITDEVNSRTWRNTFREMGAAAYLARLEQQIIDQTQIRMFQLRRRYQAAQFRRIRGPALPQITHVLDAIDDIERRRDGRRLFISRLRTDRANGWILAPHVAELVDADEAPRDN